VLGQVQLQILTAKGAAVSVPTPEEIARQFTAYYQPIVDLNTGAVSGFKALARRFGS
jgi:EAL domain-containing protein (putative c-di-GMP-specific phosphodiesterase class I)